MKSINLGEPSGVRYGGRSIAALIASAATIAMLAGCGGGGGGGGGGAQSATPYNSTLSGTFTYGGAKQAAGYTVSVDGATPAISTTTDANSKFTLVVPNVKSGDKITLDVGTSGGVFGSTDVTFNGSATQTANIALPASGTPPPPPL